ncbi:hypothetical protein [Duncaniella muris]|uniref:hypothetical protein n=1 Tax=Duncaniella muris TaxID=2094150 RepID=UPI003F678D55
MKKKRITYGVSGMMEYQAVIKVGRNNMKVLFTDGSISAMGVNPATFTTENYMVQHAIENSTDFKRGRIKVVNTIELKEELRIERNSVKPAAEVPSPNPAPTPAPISTKCENAPDTQADNKVEAEDNAETVPVTTQVEFSCNDDAKDYLEQTFGFVRSKLRNREDIVAAGKARGVDIIFV